MRMDLYRDANRLMYFLLGNKGMLKGNKKGSDYNKLFNNYKLSEDFREVVDSTANDYECDICFIENHLFLVPRSNENLLSFRISESKLKKRLGHKEYYLSNLIMAILFSELLSETKEVDYLEISDIIPLVDASLDRAMKSTNIDSDDKDLNIDILREIWFSKLPYPENSKKSAYSSRSLDYRIGYINTVISFLVEEELLSKIDDNVSATSRLKLLMESKILNTERIDEVNSLFAGKNTDGLDAVKAIVEGEGL